MALSPNTLTCFILDGSSSMARSRPFHCGLDDTRYTQHMAPIDVMKSYVKSKLCHRMMRDLKTLPVSVLSYCVPKTKNTLTARAKDSGSYDKDEDGYRHMYENVHLDWNVGTSTLEAVERIQACQGPDAKDQDPESGMSDAHTALILALETVDTVDKARGKPSWTREIYLLTDGEGLCDWDRWEETADRMNEKGISLIVIGFNFDDKQVGYAEEGKSKIKRDNEEHLRSFVSRLDRQPSQVMTASRALDSIASPRPNSKKSAKISFTLTLGDRERFPDSSLLMHVDMKKATSLASPMSMSKWSLKRYQPSTTGVSSTAKNGARGSKRAARSDDDDDETDGGEHGLGSSKRQHAAESQSHSIFGSSQIQVPSRQAPVLGAGKQRETFGSMPYSLGALGESLDKMLAKQGLVAGNDDDDDDPHRVTTHTYWRTKPIYDGKTPDELRAEEEELERMTPEQRRQRVREEMNRFPLVPEEDVASAYVYGGSYVDAADMGEGAGTLSGLETGMMITGFMRQSNFRWDWRLDDMHYVYGPSGQLGSQQIFSALVNAMIEKKWLAIVRYIGKPTTSAKTGLKKWPDPKMGVLWPACEDGVEYCYWCRMPFAEDVRQLTFPSLYNFRLTSGKEVKEHKFLPTQVQQNAMDDLVDAMDLSHAGPLGADGRPTSWFSCSDSFSPAIHNVFNAVVHRISNPEGDLPPVHPALTKYLDPPARVLEKLKTVGLVVKDAFDVTKVPPKPTKQNKKTINFNVEAYNTDPGAVLGSGATQPKSLHMPDAVLQMKASSSYSHYNDQDQPMNVDNASSPVKVRGPDSSVPKSQTAQTETLVIASEDDSGPEPDTESEPDTASDSEVLTATLASQGNNNSEPAASSLPPPPLEIPEYDPAGAFEAVANAHGIEPALNKMFDRVTKMIDSSFSDRNYAEAAAGLRRARELARQRGAGRGFDVSLDRLYAHLRSDRHSDFIAYFEHGPSRRT